MRTLGFDVGASLTWFGSGRALRVCGRAILCIGCSAEGHMGNGLNSAKHRLRKPHRTVMKAVKAEALLPLDSYQTSFFSYLIMGLGSHNRKVGYPKKGIWYESTGRSIGLPSSSYCLQAHSRTVLNPCGGYTG